MKEQYYSKILTDIKDETQLTFRRNGKEGFAVRLEDERDKNFWLPLLEMALPNMEFAFYPYFDEKNNVGITGKEDFKKYIKHADSQLIFCRDADYDYLLENSILNQPFVFHTYVYGRESFYSFSEGLKEIVETNTKETIADDSQFVDFFKAYSKIIYPYLLSSLFSTKLADGNLTARNLGKVAGFSQILNPAENLESLKQILGTGFKLFYDTYKVQSEFQVFEKQLERLGFSEENAYLFISCHDVFEKVTLKLLNHVGLHLSDKHYSILSTKKEKAEYQKYRKNEANSFEKLAQNNPKMATCSFYQRIVQDIRVAFQN